MLLSKYHVLCVSMNSDCTQLKLFHSTSFLWSSKSDSPKQQSKKLKKLLKQDKPKSKAKAEHKGSGFKLKKSAKANKKSKPKGTKFCVLNHISTSVYSGDLQ